MDHHLRWVGEIEQLPGDADFHPVTGEHVVGQGIEVLRFRIGIAIAELARLVDLAHPLGNILLGKEIGQLQGQVDGNEAGAVLLRRADIGVSDVVGLPIDCL